MCLLTGCRDGFYGADCSLLCMCVDGEVCRRYDGCECLHQEVCGVTTQIITTTDKHVANNTILIAGSVSGIVLVIILAGIVVLILVIRKRNSLRVPLGTDFIPDDITVYSMIDKYLEVNCIYSIPKILFGKLYLHCVINILNNIAF